MRSARVLISALLLATSAPAFGQETSVRETRCWVGDVAFSAGMTISDGAGASACEAGKGWQSAAADTSVAGCLLEGKFSSVGAVVGIRNNEDLLLQCEASGRWVTIEADR